MKAYFMRLLSPPHGLAPWEAKLAPPPHKAVGPAEKATATRPRKINQIRSGHLHVVLGFERGDFRLVRQRQADRVQAA